jgi:HD-GYP domain-containing protein (c-di-GMP phosphodiesterase class II)
MPQFSIKDKVEELITRLARAVQVYGLYGDEHRLTEESIDSLSVILDEILVEKKEITIGIIGNEIAFEKEPLHESSRSKKGFINHLILIGVKKISFSEGVEKIELSKFVNILNKRPEYFNREKDIRRIFHSSGISNIAIGDIGFIKKKKLEGLREVPINDLDKKESQVSANILTETYRDLKGNKRLNAESARKIVEGLLSNVLKNKQLFNLLTSMKRHSENIFEHGVNVAIFTLIQAEVLGLGKNHLADLGMAALLHDIGKLSVSEDEFKEEEQSTQDELSLEEERKKALQDVAGAKILLNSEGMGVLPAIAAFEHNIKYDMSGYPMKLYGGNLNLVSMMIAISNYYDKLRSKPSYYQEGGPEKAYEKMMKLSGKNFHPDLLENFFSVIGIYPPGTLVELDTKEIGLVIQTSVLDIKRPQIEILYDSSGEKYEDQKVVNLMEKDNEGKYKRAIVKSISPLKFRVHEEYSEL